MKKEIRLLATNLHRITPLDENYPEKPIGVPDPGPDNERIFKGSMTEFLDTAIVRANNGEDEPSRTPLDTCPTIREKVCAVCDWYDVHVGCMSGNGDG